MSIIHFYITLLNLKNIGINSAYRYSQKNDGNTSTYNCWCIFLVCFEFKLKRLDIIDAWIITKYWYTTLQGLKLKLVENVERFRGNVWIHLTGYCLIIWPVMWHDVIFLLFEFEMLSLCNGRSRILYLWGYKWRKLRELSNTYCMSVESLHIAKL